jgi:hypothetical protein
MTKKSTKAQVNSFVQGLITEASPLNFPGNATVDEQNFVLNRDGTRYRRLGLDLEPNSTLIDVGLTVDDVQNSTYIPYKWKNVGGDGDTNFLIVQVKSKLHVFDLGQSSLSELGEVGVIDLSTISFPESSLYSFASVDGKLTVAAGHSSIAIISYETGVFTIEEKQLLVRDVWGVEVTSELAYESDDQYRGGLPVDHQYNLYNQSWGIPRSNASNILSDPIQLYNGGLSKYPSNSEVVWSGLDFQAVVGGTPYERLFPTLFTDTFGSKVKASKGYFIIDALRRGQSRSAAIIANKAKHPTLSMATFTTNADYTDGGATVIAEFAGRVFFAGFSGSTIDGDSRSPTLSNHIFFSQLVKNSGDVIKCYQEGDPTSRDGSDIVDTDGGFIRIAGADNIVGMVNLGTHLIILATNGIWSVTGGSDFGFTATNYKVDRITAFGALSRSSIVEDGGQALYWSIDGIYAISKDQFGSFTANNITEKTIQTLYEDIPSASREKAIGVFDSSGKKIRWLYTTGSAFTSEYETYEIILDTVLGAFYKFRIYNTTGNIAIAAAPFAATPFVSEIVPEIVTVDSDVVLVDTDVVVVESLNRSSAVISTRYLVVILEGGIPKISFGYFNNGNFLDWESVDNTGVDAYAYFITGAITAGDSSAVKQIPYLTLHFNRTEEGVNEEMIPQKPSGCLVQSQWDFANSANSNKWSSKFQGYRLRGVYLVDDSNDLFDTGFDVVTTKNKIRGRGDAFAFRMETETSKDCQIIGWSIALNGNAVV